MYVNIFGAVIEFLPMVCVWDFFFHSSHKWIVMVFFTCRQIKFCMDSENMNVITLCVEIKCAEAALRYREGWKERER